MFDDAGLPAWFARAECATADPDAFFPDKGEDPKAAKVLCGRCPVVEDCLDLALAEDHRDGVWGGTTPRERARLARQVAA